MELSNLDSMIADYKLEFEDVHTIFNKAGFANYKFENEHEIYVQEVYVKPAFRGNKEAATLTDNCIIHAQELKGNAIKNVYTTVAIGGNTIDLSIRAITAYGFKILKADSKLIYFYKEITNE